ncbi:type II toxin-antitoxin system PemK/MazF family toxin [Erysipelotrichaceae bacterium OttesenSCG-928-M19]|nr:type II toxin-antitoxin system PemK/MazF family toxin [Erysipelotrichaceae bacterium OttesenSCG-928-M19]
MVKQGDIIMVSLDPTKGHEQQGFRPCLCLSNELVYQHSHLIIVAPISNTKRVYPLYYELTDYVITGKVMLDHLKSIDPKARKFVYKESLRKEDLLNILDLAQAIFDQ